MAKKKSSKKKKTKKTTKTNTALTQAKLISELTKGIEGLAEVTITIPLSNVTKNIHTRMFIQTKLSLPELQNMKQLGEIFMANAYYYNSSYVKNIWFVKKTKVTVSNKEESMTLTLVPFNDSYESEANTLSGATQTKNSTRSSSNNSTSNVSLKDVGGKDQSFLEDIVKKAIGTKTDIVKQAKACHEYYKKNHVYQYKETSVKDQYNRGFKSLWNQKQHSCGPGAATLYYMFKCLGLSPKILNGHGHYWIQVEINNDTYYCDQAGAEGKSNTRVMGTKGNNGNVWEGTNGGSIVMG